MPFYEYTNTATGERREVFAKMSEAPPEQIWFVHGDNWVPVRTPGPFKPLPIWKRVITAPAGVKVEDYEINYPGQKLPVSRALPLNKDPGTIVNRNGQNVRKHKDGTYSDMQGRRIVQSRADAAKHSAATGIRRD